MFGSIWDRVEIYFVHTYINVRIPLNIRYTITSLLIHSLSNDTNKYPYWTTETTAAATATTEKKRNHSLFLSQHFQSVNTASNDNVKTHT